MVRLSRLRHRLHAAAAGAARSTAGPRTAPGGLLWPTAAASTRTTWRTWGDADAGHAEGPERAASTIVAAQGRAPAAGRARLLRRNRRARRACLRVALERLVRA